MDRVCPLLGLSLERRFAVEGVDDAHRCHAEIPPSALNRRQQAQVCLTSEYDQCERYLGYLSRAALSPSSRVNIADGLVSTRLLLTPEPSWRGIAGRDPRGRHVPLLAIVAAVVAMGIGGVTLAGAMIDGGIPFYGAAPSGSASTESATVTPPASPLPTLTPGPTPLPSPTSSPSPTPSPSPAQTAPTAVPQQTYTVQEGDNLAEIAQQFGTTVEALQDANDIEDPNTIIVGQVLLIP